MPARLVEVNLTPPSPEEREQWEKNKKDPAHHRVFCFQDFENH
jgi:hypothetical protein